MASSSAEFLPFGQALQRCGLFQVPDYQRTFAWESKQLNDLVSDLARAANSTNELHHPMGTLFLQKSQNPVRNHLDETLDVRFGFFLDFSVSFSFLASKSLTIKSISRLWRLLMVSSD
jgi:hypothetical protein